MSCLQDVNHFKFDLCLAVILKNYLKIRKSENEFTSWMLCMKWQRVLRSRLYMLWLLKTIWILINCSWVNEWLALLLLYEIYFCFVLLIFSSVHSPFMFRMVAHYYQGSSWCWWHIWSDIGTKSRVKQRNEP